MVMAPNPTARPQEELRGPNRTARKTHGYLSILFRSDPIALSTALQIVSCTAYLRVFIFAGRFLEQNARRCRPTRFVRSVEFFFNFVLRYPSPLPPERRNPGPGTRPILMVVAVLLRGIHLLQIS